MSLNRVQAALKRYRASVLKAACEGRLVHTEAELARRESRPYEPATTLLARILEQCRATWSGRGKYEPPSEPHWANSERSELPEGWAWASFDHVNFDGRRVPIKSADRDKRSGPFPYYGASGVIDDIDDFLFDGTFLLLGEDGANLLSRSTPIAFRASGKFWVNNHAHIVQGRCGIPLNFLEHYLNGKDLKFYVTGSAQPKLTQASMNRLPVPLPPLAEQHRIVAEVERRLSVIEELEAVVAANLQRAARLRQAILHRAFTGKLVSSAPRLAVVEADPYVPGVTVSVPSLSAGAYTLPDAARLLQLPLARLRSWVRGSVISEGDGDATDRHLPAGNLAHRGEGRDRHFGFLTLIELFTIGQLRERGVSMKKLRDARDELEKRYNTPHPFALHGLLTDGKSLLYNLGNDVLLELGKNGQTAFEKVLEQFCHRLEFDEVTKLVSRFYPAGRESAVVVDPRHSFGRPIIVGTNIATEAIASLIRGGETIEDIAADFRLAPEQVADAWNFECREAA